jgi:hypothetical protein
MHTYMRNERERSLWTVFFIDGSTRYLVEEFDNAKAAAAYVSYLNGGEHPRKPFPPEV